MNLAIAAGGTGGHLFPGIAVGEVLRERGHAVMLLISEKEIDALAAQGCPDFRIEKVRGAGFEGTSPLALLRFFLRFRSGLKQVKALFREFKPNVVLGMGGFTSTGPILAGRWRKIPTFVHESNAIPGKANRLNARLATGVLLSFAVCARKLPSALCEVTGTPIRRSLKERIPRSQALEAFGLSAERRTLLVMGGSQGAHGINSAMIEALPALRDRPLQVVHLTGRDDEEMVREKYALAGVPAFVSAFWNQMGIAYSAADFCVARSGAASLAELSLFSLPSVLIPYPFAAEDHQTVNAGIYERSGAAVFLAQDAITGDVLARHLIRFLDDPEYLSAMATVSGMLAQKDAAEKVANTLLEACLPPGENPGYFRKS